MITIIHGTDTASSRKYFLDLKQKQEGATILNGKNLDLTDLVQIFEGGELFRENKNFFIEELIGKNKKNKDLTNLISYLSGNSTENNIYIWEDQEMTKAALNFFKNVEVKSFKLPQTLFSFLDNIKPNNGNTLIRLFHETIEFSDPEMVYFMMVRQVRLLLGLAETASDPIEEVKRMAPWQRGKLQRQADYFEISELKKLYNKLFEIEKNMKTGNLSSSLTSTIDFLLLGI